MLIIRLFINIVLIRIILLILLIQIQMDFKPTRSNILHGRRIQNNFTLIMNPKIPQVKYDNYEQTTNRQNKQQDIQINFFTQILNKSNNVSHIFIKQKEKKNKSTKLGNKKFKQIKSMQKQRLVEKKSKELFKKQKNIKHGQKKQKKQKKNNSNSNKKQTTSQKQKYLNVNKQYSTTLYNNQKENKNSSNSAKKVKNASTSRQKYKKKVNESIKHIGISQKKSNVSKQLQPNIFHDKINKIDKTKINQLQAPAKSLIKKVKQKYSVQINKNTKSISTKKKANNGVKKIHEDNMKTKKLIISEPLSINIKQFKIVEDIDQLEILSRKYHDSNFDEIDLRNHNKNKISERKKKQKINFLDSLIKIQKVIKGFIYRKRFQKQKAAAIVIQKYFRKYLQNKRQKFKKSNYNMPRQILQRSQTISSQQARKISKNQIRNRLKINISPELILNTSNQYLFDLPRRTNPDTFIQSPVMIMQTLPNLQKFHKQKLIYNTNIQKANLRKLLEQKICSPRSIERKQKELQERLKYQLQRFQNGIREVMRGWELSNQNAISMTPQNQDKKILESKSEENKKLIQTFKQNYEYQQLSDQKQKIINLSSEELNQYLKQQNFEDLKFDSSLLFLQHYLNSLFEFLNTQEQWKSQFFILMQNPKSSCFRYCNQNQYIIFKQQQSIIPLAIIQEFNSTFQKLKRHINPIPQSSQLQEIHLKLVIDVLNEQLYNQKQGKPIFKYFKKSQKSNIHSSLLAKTLSSEQLQFNNYFAYAYDSIYKYATQLCGFIQDTKQIEVNYLNLVNECRLTQMMNEQFKKILKDNSHEQEIQIQLKIKITDIIWEMLLQEFSIELQQ